jgi:fibro-slime domain-containing protein
MIRVQPLPWRAWRTLRLLAASACAAALFQAAPAGAAIMGHYFDFCTQPLHPDIEANAINTGFTPGMVNSTLSGDFPTLTPLGLTRVKDFNWWGNSPPGDNYPMTHVFDRLDANLDFSAFNTSWFPTSTSIRSPYKAFAAYWSGCATVSQDGIYNLQVAADDDFWLFMDNQLVIDDGGLHSITSASGLVHLAAGAHKFDAFFAQRHTGESALQLKLPNQITLDENCPSPPLSGVPEPATLALLGTGLLGVALLRRRMAARAVKK